MEDMRKYNGGSKNAGRKSKSEEQDLIEKLSPYEPIAIKVLGEALEDPKSQSWAIPLYFGYMYGKPRQTIDQTVTEMPTIVFKNVSKEYNLDNNGNISKK